MKKDVESLVARHDRLWHDPANAERLVTFAWYDVPGTDFRKVFADPQRSLDYSLACLEKALSFPDDSIPMIRVEIGTGLAASAFGAELLVTAENLPAVRTHPIRSMQDLSRVSGPDPARDGQFPRVYEHIRHFRSHMPAGVSLCQCDLQGPWNTAHLVAGDKIFLDVYDDTALLDSLLDRTLDFQVRAIRAMKDAVGEPWEFFNLQGTRIPGASRLCNCSTDMISAEFYEEHLLLRDTKFFESMGGGMMHICGHNTHCIRHFNSIGALRGLEINFNYMDVFQIADLLREDIVLLCTGPVERPLLTPLGELTLRRLCNGEAPDKRNILFHFDDPADMDKCNRLYDGIRRS